MQHTNTLATELGLLTQEQAAGELGKSTFWMERSRWSGTGPVFLRIGRSVYYKRDDLVSWLDAQRRESTRGEPIADKSAG